MRTLALRCRGAVFLLRTPHGSEPRLRDNAGRCGGRAGPFAGDGGAAARADGSRRCCRSSLRWRNCGLNMPSSPTRRHCGGASLKIAIAAYGNASVPAAEAMAALARLYIELRRYLDAEPLAIAADERSVAPGSGDPKIPRLAPVLADRARIALARGETSHARKWAEAGDRASTKEIDGAPRSDRLRVLGAVLAAEGRFDESERVAAPGVGARPRPTATGSQPRAAWRSSARPICGKSALPKRCR